MGCIEITNRSGKPARGKPTIAHRNGWLVMVRTLTWLRHPDKAELERKGSDAFRFGVKIYQDKSLIRRWFCDTEAEALTLIASLQDADYVEDKVQTDLHYLPVYVRAGDEPLVVADLTQYGMQETEHCTGMAFPVVPGDDLFDPYHEWCPQLDLAPQEEIASEEEIPEQDFKTGHRLADSGGGNGRPRPKLF